MYDKCIFMIIVRFLMRQKFLAWSAKCLIEKWVSHMYLVIIFEFITTYRSGWSFVVSGLNNCRCLRFGAILLSGGTSLSRSILIWVTVCPREVANTNSSSVRYLKSYLPRSGILSISASLLSLYQTPYSVNRHQTQHIYMFVGQDDRIDQESRKMAQLLVEQHLKPALKAVIMFVRVLQKGFHKN